MAKNRAISAPVFKRQQRDTSGLFRTPSVPSGIPQDEPASAEQLELDRLLKLLINLTFSIQFFKHSENAKMPAYGRDGDACLDLYACLEQDQDLFPEQRLIIPTGVGVCLPPGFELQIRPRSGNSAKLGLTILNTPGTIDSNYRGVIGVILYNTSQQKVIIKHHDPVAQAKFSWAPLIKVVEIKKEDASETNRGEQGYGSTGLVGGKS